MRRVPQPNPNFTVRRERDGRAFKRLVLLLACGLLLAGGFVAAAGQHFAAVQHGYRSEELRRERERLLEEQRRLLLTLEETASPARLGRAARSLGLQPTRPAQIGTPERRGETNLAEGRAASRAASAPAPATLIAPSAASALRSHR